jgi:hypothetical protein
MKAYTYTDRSNGVASYIKRSRSDSGGNQWHRVTYVWEREVVNQVYLNLTMGMAKRIARNHKYRFRPWTCGVGLRKLRCKLYNPNAHMNYSSKTRKLHIQHGSYYKSRVTEYFEVDNPERR